jgi:riboflavin kinase/FMN adenylyltransferase
LRVHTDISALEYLERPVLTIGTFDGVHHGHRKILDRVIALAKENNGTACLLTFHPHPRSVVNEAKPMVLLNSLEEKLELLEKAGLDHVIVQPFTKAFSRMTALEYVRDLLVTTIGVHHLVVGYDHHFGRNREGDIKVLREYADLFGFKLEEIPAQTIEEVKISSTKIRLALDEGKVSLAREYLGYSYCLSGTVVHGDGRGKGLGFPTANLVPNDPEKVVPGNGVYAVHVKWKDQEFKGMANIGIKPTFHTVPENPSIEVNVFELDRDLYGQELSLSFEERIRDELKFESAEELIKQLNLDKEQALKI